MGLPENIDALLVKFDIAQEQLARVAGVHPSSAVRWRRGAQMRRPYLDRIPDTCAGCAGCRLRAIMRAWRA